MKGETRSINQVNTCIVEIRKLGKSLKASECQILFWLGRDVSDCDVQIAIVNDVQATTFGIATLG